MWRTILAVSMLSLCLCVLHPACRPKSIIALASHSSREQAAEKPPTSKIDGIFASVTDAKSPGLAALVVKDGHTVFQRGYGVRDLRTLDKIDAETNFRLASCTKQFTAMATMLLVHDGRLRYEERLTEVFPEFPAYGKAITIRNLLDHTSGLVDYESLMEQEERAGTGQWDEQKQIQGPEVLTLLETQNSTLFPPGTKWAYSNSGYVLLGLVVAKISGQSFGEFLRQRIFAPLKMDNTLAYEKGKNEVPHRAFGSHEGAERLGADRPKLDVCYFGRWRSLFLAGRSGEMG
jgi:CubicO group peptidase (beta-lactamase class C family)